MYRTPSDKPADVVADWLNLGHVISVNVTETGGQHSGTYLIIIRTVVKLALFTKAHQQPQQLLHTLYNGW